MRGRGSQAWSVEIEGHRVSRWEIPESTVEVFAPDATTARADAVRAVHRAAGCPPWRPLLRYSFVRSRATRMEREARAA
jgi:hypothetical protein